MDIHPAANIYPAMTPDEYEALKNDIAANGLQQAILLMNGAILDGRHRWQAIEELERSGQRIDVRFEVYKGAAPVATVHSLNFHRRHLNTTQKACIGNEFKKELQKEIRQGERTDLTSANICGSSSEGREARKQAADLVGVSHTVIDKVAHIEREAPALYESMQSGGLSVWDAERELHRAEQKQKQDAIRQDVALPDGKFHTLIIDPPWPIKKIERDCRPRQAEMDYPMMSEAELLALPVPELSHDDAHLYLWTTHKYLPLALQMVEAWGYRYQCVMTWVKNVGFTPFSWMYSTEHVIFARRGNQPLLEMGKRLDFHAPVREHSRKPDEFYDLVRACSPGPRLDMFARQQREGFANWGNETARFDDTALETTDAEEGGDNDQLAA